jgi:fibronectin type 3 domain-containing protein
MMNRYTIIGLLIIVFVIGCSNDIDPPSGVSSIPDQPETPHGLTAAIGDGIVLLDWKVNKPSAIDSFAVYFSDSAAFNMSLLDNTQNTTYTADGLTNGRRYFFRVAAIDKANLEGEKSRTVVATPGVFSITIENGRVYVNDRNVSVQLTAPEETDLVQLSEDSDFGDSHWQTFASSMGFELSDVDGTKHLYARFQLGGSGNSASFVSDSIVLDRLAVIDSVVENSAGVTLSAGDTVHFSVYTSEAGGEAAVEISGLGDMALNDMGEVGDNIADDGIYELDFTIPIGTELVEAEVIGKFTDAAGNNAPNLKASTRLNATFPPDPVTLTGYAVSWDEILLEWTKSDISDFAAYRLFRSETQPVDQNSDLVTTISDKLILSYRDTGLTDNTQYYYRLFVFDNSGDSAQSEELAIQTMNNEPPDPVTLTGFALSSHELLLEWTRSNIDDFKNYRLFRSDASVVDSSSFLVTTIGSQLVLSYNDTGLVDDKTYYYRLFVYDQAGKMAGSTELSLNTLVNEPPDTVALAADLTGDTLSVELSWQQANDADFSSYRVIRDTSPLPLNYDADLQIKIINTRSTVSLFDDVPVAGQYYYQVYVFDKQGLSTGSNTVSAIVP